MSPTTPVEWVHELLERLDGDVTVETGSESMWSGQLRLTLTDPKGAPSRSMAFYVVACENPDQVIALLCMDAQKWMRETGVEPLRPQDRVIGT